MEKDNKWGMFRNFMYNELGITKNDIRTWIKEAVDEEAKKLIAQSAGKYNIDSLLKDQINDKLNDYYFKREIVSEIAKNITIEYEK